MAAREPPKHRDGAAQLRKPEARKPPAAMTHTGGERSGETIFDAQALRMRSLTLATADIPALQDPTVTQGGFKIRVAKLGGRRREAGKLVERRYLGRGYTIPVGNSQSELTTFIAYDEGTLVGTVSVRLDSPNGLSADEHFHAEVEALRGGGARLCEFTRLAVDRTVASKPVLAGLFHTAYLYASVLSHCTHAVIEVNPRHVTFYRRALGFDTVGEERVNRRVGAPAVLLGTPFSHIRDGIARYAGKPSVVGASRSLFLYGFPPEEEPGVLARLRSLVAAS